MTSSMRRVVILAILSTALLSAAIAGTIAVGEIAPDFTLSDQDGDSVTLSKQRGRKVVLVFYRGYW